MRGCNGSECELITKRPERREYRTTDVDEGGSVRRQTVDIFMINATFRRQDNIGEIVQ